MPQSVDAQIVLVSNDGQAAATDSNVTSTQSRSQRFTTGSNPGGYSLSSVEFETTNDESFAVQVCEVSGIAPTSTCTELTTLDGNTAGRKSFTAPTGTVLSAGTYSLLMTNTGTAVFLTTTTSNAEDAGKVSGFSIANAYDFQQMDDSWGTVGNGKSYKVVIKGTVVGAPTVTGTAVTSSPAANGNYETGEVIQVTVTFDDAVTVDTASGTPRLALTIGSRTRHAEYSASASTTTALVFAYPVVAEDTDNDGISIAASALELNGGAIHKEGDASTHAVLNNGAVSTQSGHRVNQTDAFIVSGGVSVISTPQARDETYGAGEVIEIEVEFSTAVSATAGTDFVISVAGRKRAALLRGNGTDTLVFGYTVQAADSDGNGIWIGDQDRTLVGNRDGDAQNGAITSVATGRAADLTHAELATLSGHKVDGSLTPPASTDATLSALSLGTGVTLNEAFSSDTYVYTADVANSVGQVTVTATKNHTGANVVYQDASANMLEDANTTTDGHQVALAVGDTVFVVKVTAEDTTSTQTYWVTVTRAAGASAPVWSATMTAGETKVGHGYDATDTPAIGTLDDVDFNYGPTPETTLFYTVRAIDVANVFRFVVQPSLPTDEALTLEFGGHAFAFSDRVLAISIGGSSVWTVPDALDDLATEFPVGSTATVCLRTATQVCPTGRIVTPNNPPVFTSSATLSAEENQTELQVVAVDNDAADDVTGYAITGGADMALFEIGATSGELTFKSAPDFEDPQDTGTDNVHEVTVRATSGAGTRVMTADQTIAVTVTNADEGQSGTVTIDDTAPTVGDELTASAADAADPDGLPDPFAPTWKWYRTPDGGSETEITGETSATYTVVAADLGATLTAKASWIDKGGFENTLASAATGAVAAAGALPTLSVESAWGTEGSLFTFLVSLSAEASETVTVQCRASFETGDTAVAADLSSTTGTATIRAGSMSGLCSIRTAQDSTDEENETFTVTLSGVSSNAQLAADPTAKGTINDDDDPPTLSVADVSAEEGTALTFTVALSAASGKTVTVDWAASAESGDTATAGTDFTAVSATTLTFDAGQEEKTVTVQTTEDSADEEDETFTVTLSSPSNATIPDATAKGTIEDDDGGMMPVTPPAQSLVSNIGQGNTDSHTATSARSQRFTIGSSATASRYTLTGVDVVSGGTRDFTAQVCGVDSNDHPTSTCTDLMPPGTFAAGTMSFTAPENATLDKGETYAVVLTPVGSFIDYGRTTSEAEDLGKQPGWTIANEFEYHAGFSNTWVETPGYSVRIAIKGSAVPDTPSLSIADAAGDEDAGVTFTATLTAGVSGTVTATWTASIESGDTAVAADLATTKTGDVEFEADAETTTFTVPVTDDSTDEENETFTVTLSGVSSNAQLAADPTAEGTIVDDDDPPTVSVNDVSATEGDPLTFTVTLSAASGKTVTVAYATADDTATAPSDYTNASDTLTFDAGVTTQTITVATTEDTTVESSETISVLLTNATNATISDDTGTGTIVDDDTAPTITNVAVTSTPVLATDTYGAGEEILFTVTFSGAVDATGDPEFAFSLDTGEDRAPYKSGSGTTALVFAYTVAPGDEDDDGIFLLDGSDFNNRVGAVTLDSDDAIEAAGSTTDADLAHTGDRGTQSGHKVDGSRSIVSVAVTSTPLLETDTYGAGETIEFTVTFNVAVDVTGDPVFTFALDGGASRSAAYVTGGGTTALVFGYPVVSGDTDANGIFLWDEADFDDPDGPVRPDSNDEIEFKDTSTDVPLYWSGRGTQSGHKVDGSRTAGNTAPSFTSSAAFDAAENQARVGIVQATDSDTDDDVTGYAITGGADETLFRISGPTGLMRFDAVPDYEDPDDSDTNNTYVVEVTATSGAGTRVMTATQTITVTVTNADEGQSGTVTIDDTTPMVGDELTASTANAADPDGLPDPFAPTWKWYRTPDGGSETEITGETSATYTVVAADLDATLAAKASWTDTGGFANTLASAATSAVAAASALPTLSVGNASATEGSLIQFVVTLSAAASENVTATCTPSFESSDTAVAADLSTTTSTLIIFASQTTGTCLITTVQDTTDEDDETFTVTLSNPSSNAQLGTQVTAKGTIVDDDTAPTVTGVEVTSEPVLETDTYGAGERIEVSVTFSEAVNATSATDFVLSVGGATRAALVSGSGTATLVFGYTVAPGDEDDDGIWIGDDTRTLVGDRNGNPQAGAIASTATGTAADLDHTGLPVQTGHKVDGSRSIVGVAIPSRPVLETDTYGAGETIRFRVTFTAAVDVTGDPVFRFSLGNSGDTREVDAAYEGGTGTDKLVFGYTVVSTDVDNDGIFLLDDAELDAPDGPVRPDSDDEIEFKDTSIDVPLKWPEGRAGLRPNHKVDGSRTTGNAAPSFTSSATFDNVAENQTAVGTVVAADSDADDSVTGYAITGGADMALFEIGATSGELTFKSAPNYEDPQDSGTDNIHEVTVRATSGAGTRAMTADQTIAVTVTNVDEGQSGTVTIDDTAPTVGDELTARTANVADPDGLPLAPVSWQWYRTPDGGSETAITGETSATYTVVAADLGATLTAKASWTDKGGFANTLASAATSAVAAASALPTLSVGNASATEGSPIVFPLTLTAAATERLFVTCTASIESGDTAVAADLTTTLTGTGTIVSGGTSGTCDEIATMQDTLDEDDETFTVTLSNVSASAQLATDPTAKGTILDDDDPPTVSVEDVSAEEGTALTFTVALSAASGKTVTVDWAASAETGDTATAGTDFTAVAATTLTFDAGQEEKTVTVQTTEDSADENDETFTVTLSSPSNATLSTTDATAKGTIEDDDGTTLPTLSIGNASAAEGADISFPLTLSAAASAAVTVTCTASFETGDTAVAADLSATTSTATIQIGATSGSCSILSVQDTTDEDDETFTVTLSNVSTNAQVAADPTATGTIDDDPPVLSFKQASYTAAEGGSAVEVELTLTSALPDILVVTMTAEHGAGATAEDYTGISDGTSAIFTAGRTRSVFEVTASDDAFDEADETVTFGFTIPSSADVTEGSVSEATLTLTDNDDPPTVTVGDAEATEGGKVEFEVTLSAVSGRDVTVDYATSVGTGQTATSGDFTAATGTLTILASDATDTGTVEVQTTGDSIEEENETFTLTISSPTNATLGTKTTATGTIEDDDTAPTVTGVSVTSTPVLATDTYGAGETIEVSVTFSEAVTATTDTDFELNVNGDESAPLLRGSGTATLVFGYTVAPGDEDDNGIWIGDQDRTLVGDRRLTTQAGTITSTATGVAADLTHGVLGTQSGHKVDGSRSIVSVEVTSMPQLETDTYGATETIQFTVTFNTEVDVDGDPVLKFVLGNQGQVREVDAAYDMGGGSTALVFDYTVVATDVDNNGIFLRDEDDYDDPDGPVRLDSNDEIEFKNTSIDVPLYWAGRGNHPNHKVDGSRTAGNAAPSFTSSAAFDAAENQTAVGTVAATDSDADDSVTGYEITGGADQGAFSIGATSGVLTFNSAPNFEAPSDTDTNGSYVVEVTATSGAGTRVMTADQTITVTVTDVDEGQSGTVTIDDTTPMVGDELTASTANAADPDGLPDPFAPTWKWYRTPDGGSETEITGATSATYTVVAADLGATLAAKASWTDNGGFENTLASAATSAVAAASALPTLSVGNASGAEGLNVFFLVRLSATASQDVTVTCTASFESGDTAAAADLSTTTGTATIQAGTTTGSCAIGTVSDSTDEEDETFTVTLSNPSSNALLAADPTAKGTINDDDDPPTVSVADVSAEEGTALSFTVALSAASGKTVTVDWAASAESGDTATAGTDFTAVAATTLTFDAGQEEKTVTVQTTEDSTDENDETFTVTLSNPSNATLSTTNATAKGTIEDDDGTVTNNAPVFSSDDAFDAAENQTAVGTVLATDSDADDSVTGYEITGGADQGAFSIGATSGVLTFNSAPNFEAPSDTDTNGSYVVTVQATSGAGTREMTATQTITVTVTNADEGQSGTVTIDDTMPMVGDELTASTANAADPDGLPDPFAPTWKWYRTPDGGSETEISGAASATYTVVAADLGATLTAKASWTDKGGFENTLSSAPTSAVAAASALPTLSVADAAGTEGGNVTFTATLSATAAADVTATWTASVETGDTAADADLGTTKTGMVTVTMGQPSGTFEVATAEDTAHEEDETFTVTLSNVSSNAQLAADPTARGTIEDDDLPTVGFSEDSIFIVEERGEIEFKVKLSAPSTVPIAVDWETEADSAEADVDYTEASGTLTFAPGDTEKTITVDLIDDEIIEQLETFTVRLSGTDDALVTLGTSSSIGRIIDRDGAEISFAEETTVEEDAGTVTLTLTASAPSTAAYTIDYETEDGTAVAGTDYTAASGTVRFPALQTERTITITVLEDTADEGSEYFTVKLDEPSNRQVNLATSRPPRVLIVDKIAPAPEDLEAEPVEGSYTSLAVSWEEPDTAGAPPLIGYEVRYRERPDGDWTDWPHAGTVRTATLDGLEVSTAYEVQVRALYGETQSVWVAKEVRTPTPPPARVRNVSIVNGPGSDGEWNIGERVELEVVYPEPVVVEKPEDCWSYNADGTCKPSGPYVLVSFRDDARPGYGTSLSTPLAPYVGGSGTATLRFAYTVGEDEDGALRVSVADDGILLRGATIRTLEGGEGKSEYTNTRVAQVTVPTSGRAWTAGEKVRVQVRFTGPAPYAPPDDPKNRDKVVVDESEGAPTIDLLLGDRADRTLGRTASYVRGSGSDTLEFEYAVAAGDGRVGAVEVVADSLAKNGATIRNKQDYDAELEHLGAVQYAQRAALSVADAEATEGEDATLDFVVKLDGVPGEEDVTVAYRTQDEDGEAEAGSDYTETRGTLRFARGEDVYEKTVSVPITDDAEEDGGETFKLLLSNVTGAAVKNYEAVGTIRNDETPPLPELTAEFEGMPAEHDGQTEFTFRVAFSEDIEISLRPLRENAFTVTNGHVTRWARVDDRRDLFEMTVQPDSDGDVTITLEAGRECGVSGAICTKGDNRRQLANSPSATVAGLPGISVADARVKEGEGVALAFAVTLSRAAGGTVTVDYATSDGSAQAGVDYTAASGTLTFQAGESSRTIEVGVLDDSHDEGEETLTLRLSNASGARVTDGEATGTIKNHDPMPRAFMARFGRTSALHVVEHVEERLEAPRAPGFRGRFAGRALRRGMERDMAVNFLRQLGSAAGVHPAGMGGHGPMAGSRAADAWPLGMPGRGGGGLMMGAGGPMSGAAGMGGAGASLQTPGLGAAGFGGAAPLGAGPMGGQSGPDGGFDRDRLLRMGRGGGDLLIGSDFAMNRETRGGILSIWSRGAQSRFSGREGALSVGGDVRTTMFGADYARGPLVVGLSLSNSRGLGEYTGAAGGQVDSSVTGLYPWLGYQVTERVKVWGVAGYGRGGLLLTLQSGQALESRLSMAMAAAGTRGELLGGGAGGFGLAFKADVLWVGTSIDGVDGPAGRLKATDAAVTRFRTGLEGSRAFTLAGRLSLTPSVEAGLRHDGGDAETGAGLDVGAGLVVSDAGTGLALDVRVRTLLVHQAEGFRERGVALSLSYNPTPSSPLGFLVRMAPSWGGQATSGAEALWGRETMAGMAHGGIAQGTSLDAEVGYGLPVGSRLVGTPTLGLRTSEQGRDYRLGYSLGVLSRGSVAFELGVEAQRRENPMRESAENGVLGRASLDW